MREILYQSTQHIIYYCPKIQIKKKKKRTMYKYRNTGNLNSSFKEHCKLMN